MICYGIEEKEIKRKKIQSPLTDDHPFLCKCIFKITYLDFLTLFFFFLNHLSTHIEKNEKKYVELDKAHSDASLVFVSIIVLKRVHRMNIKMFKGNYYEAYGGDHKNKNKNKNNFNVTVTTTP